MIAISYWSDQTKKSLIGGGGDDQQRAHGRQIGVARGLVGRGLASASLWWGWLNACWPECLGALGCRLGAPSRRLGAPRLAGCTWASRVCLGWPNVA